MTTNQKGHTLKPYAGPFSLAGYLALIILTNVGFDRLGPSWPVFACVGLTLVARDFVHRYYGARWSIALIIVGAIVSAFLASPAVALASLVAFAAAELIDLGVYVAARRRNYLMSVAVLVSGIVGSVVDSAVFLTIAFGSLDFFWFQVTGKIAATVAAALVIAVIEARSREVATA